MLLRSYLGHADGLSAIGESGGRWAVGHIGSDDLSDDLFSRESAIRPWSSVHLAISDHT